MKRQWVSLVLIGCVMAAVMIAIVWPREREPEYGGKRLSEWLMIYEQNKNAEGPAADAVRRIGTNALPYLMSWISYKPSKFTVMLVKTFPNLPDYMYPKWIVRAYLLGDGARGGFEILGQAGSPAIPKLASLANDPREGRGRIAHRAIDALGSIGPQALPALLDVVTNTQAGGFRYVAEMEIASFGTNALPALPVLIQCLRDQEQDVAYGAADALGRIALAPALVVPALTSCLGSSNPMQRAVAARALSKFGEAARSAVPEIRNTLSDGNDYVRGEATNALLQIAPELLAPAGARSEDSSKPEN